MFQGVFTALITPFKNGKLDEKSFQDLVEWQIKEGVHGLVPCGTTGECPTLSHEEHNRVVSLCVEAAAGRVPVMAGAGSNSTDEALMMARHAKKAGAAALLVVAPYYNKPTQEGLYQHFKALNDGVDLPVFLYNVPGRSVVDIRDETTARLAKLKNIVGIKDASGDLEHISSLRMTLGESRNDFCQFSGDDSTALAFNAQGGRGVISVTSNIAPRLCAELQNAWFSGDLAKAFAIHEQLMPVHMAMFCESNPVPVKYAASLLGFCDPSVRLPLVTSAAASQQRIRAALEEADILNEKSCQANRAHQQA